jgi:hypothetical protein
MCCCTHRLGEFHPQLAARREPDAQDIDDPLYGNMGGAQEREDVAQAAALIEHCCRGLVAYLVQLKEEAAAGGGDAELAAMLRQRVAEMQGIQWLVPPLLQGQMDSPFV